MDLKEVQVLSYFFMLKHNVPMNLKLISLSFTIFKLAIIEMVLLEQGVADANNCQTARISKMKLSVMIINLWVLLRQNTKLPNNSYNYEEKQR